MNKGSKESLTCALKDTTKRKTASDAGDEVGGLLSHKENRKLKC